MASKARPRSVGARTQFDMDYKLRTPSIAGDLAEEVEPTEPSSYRISSRPIIEQKPSIEEPKSNDLPRSYGTETLTLMARDPRTLFAYWDIDWPAAFREEPPKHRQTYLRILDNKGVELVTVEVEPMAGNSYVTVPDADTAYQGEIGYFYPAKSWHSLASSEIVTTPADTIVTAEEPDFATVPFHLSFQHMVDLLRVSKQENESLTSKLSDLRQRAVDAEEQNNLSQNERDLAQVLEAAASNAPIHSRIPGRSDFWTQQRIERILGIGGSSPTNGFGGSSRPA